MTLFSHYWGLRGFDITNSAAMQKGLQISGNHNLIEEIHAYRNGNTEIQISGSSNDPFEAWPAHNLVKNCTSFENADPGFEDADGFAAKLTIGEGNVFDGCIAYHNADDGWDLFAKNETGSIGKVIIKNSVAYRNGWVPGIEGEGNGNGFKMGGSSSYYMTANTSREFRPNTSSTTYPFYLGTTTYYWHYAYLGSNTVKIGSTASSKIGFFAGTPLARQTLSSTSQNMGYSTATASNYLKILNNLVGILVKYGLIGT